MFSTSKKVHYDLLNDKESKDEKGKMAYLLAKQFFSSGDYINSQARFADAIIKENAKARLKFLNGGFFFSGMLSVVIPKQICLEKHYKQGASSAKALTLCVYLATLFSGVNICANTSSPYNAHVFKRLKIEKDVRLTQFEFSCWPGMPNFKNIEDEIKIKFDFGVKNIAMTAINYDSTIYFDFFDYCMKQGILSITSCERALKFLTEYASENNLELINNGNYQINDQLAMPSEKASIPSHPEKSNTSTVFTNVKNRSSQPQKQLLFFYNSSKVLPDSAHSKEVDEAKSENQLAILPQGLSSSH